jgi:hypothetical protein
MLTMGNSSLQREMDKFIREAHGREFNIRGITKSAFSQSRKQLKPEAFLELNELVCNEFYEGAPYLGYNNHRVLGLDGSRLLLPNSEDIAQGFGTVGYGPNADVQRSLATVSFLYDVGNYLTLDVQVAAQGGSEKSLLYKHLEKVKAGDLLLMDRGYPSKALLGILAGKGIEFCVRMKEDWWLQVNSFAQSNAVDSEVVFEPSDKDRKEYGAQYPEMKQKVKCRLVKVLLDNGLTEILCTSLLDTQKYPLADFKEVYHLRWGIEEGFKMFKSRVNIEAFTGKSAVSVKQDIYAKAMMMSLCAAFAFPIEQKVKAEYAANKDLKHPQKINRTTAYANTKAVAISMFLKSKVKQAIAAFDDIVYNTRGIVRPNRKNPRNHRPKQQHYMNYKHI